MLLVAIALTFVGGLAVARHLVEPSCPACSAKSWKDHPPRLECAACGWTTVPVAAESTSHTA